jgi:solute carrier family 25 protein 16
LPPQVSSPASSSPLSNPHRTPIRLFSFLPILKFYRGFTVSLIGMIPYAGTSFLIWGNLRARFIPIPPKSPSNPDAKPPPRPVADLIIGAISGATAMTVSYPFEIVRRRMQVGGLIRPDQWVGFGETVRTVWMESGWRGFFVGLSIGFLKGVPMTAVSYATWEGMKRILEV